MIHTLITLHISGLHHCQGCCDHKSTPFFTQ